MNKRLRHIIEYAYRHMKKNAKFIHRQGNTNENHNVILHTNKNWQKVWVRI